MHKCSFSDLNLLGVCPQIEIGLLLGNSQVIFEKSESSSMTLVGEYSAVSHAEETSGFIYKCAAVSQ